MSAFSAFFPTDRVSTDERPREATRPPERAPYRGPVLMGDLVGQWGGRPWMLMHWDARDEDAD